MRRECSKFPCCSSRSAYGTLGLFGSLLLVLIARTSLLHAGVAAIAMAMCWYFFQELLGLQLATAEARPTAPADSRRSSQRGMSSRNFG